MTLFIAFIPYSFICFGLLALDGRALLTRTFSQRYVSGVKQRSVFYHHQTYK